MYSAWSSCLPENDPKREYLLSGIHDGFHIVDPDSIIPEVYVPNYKSATSHEHFEKVQAQIIQEIENGRYIITDDKPRMISAIGALPKKDPNKIRIIHDCSRPTGSSLNSYATPDHFSYQNIQDATDYIRPGSFMAKVDLSEAFRSVKIHLHSRIATGLQWCFSGDSEPTYLVDHRLPYGASMSPQICNDLTQAVCRIMHHNGFGHVIVYLDDFLVITNTEQECFTVMNELLKLLRSLGFAINYGKLIPPTTRITFLGIILDSQTMCVELPQEKLCELRSLLNRTLTLKKITKRSLQSLAGKLNWATQCIHGGRFHLRRIIDKITPLRHPGHRTRVTADMRADIIWWLGYMDVFNGSVRMLDDRPTTPVYIDACSIACGAFHGSDFVYTPWQSWKGTETLHINHKETLSILPAICRWSSKWTNKRVVVHCDNQAAVSILNKGSSRNPLVMEYLRQVFWFPAMYNFRIQAVYHPGSENYMADAISRLHEPYYTKHLLPLLNIHDPHWTIYTFPTTT